MRGVLYLLASSKHAIGNATPQSKLATMLIAKKPRALPTTNAIPIAPLAMNSHFMLRSDFLEKIGATRSKAIPINPYPSAAKAQNSE